MLGIFSQFDIWAIADVAIIAVIVYNLLLLLRGTRTMQMITGILIVAAVFVFSNIFPLMTVKWLLNKFFSSFLIIMVILFQDDLRRMLSRMGKRGILASNDAITSKQMLDEITRAASVLTSKRLGALIVIERNIILNRYVDVGLLLDSKVSMEILLAIFNKESPIHDGAVIIQQGRLAAAGCFLPLTRDETVNPNMGTRHRAAIGISQETDAIVVVCSEERGVTSIIADGKISRSLEPKELRKALRNLLYDPETREQEKEVSKQQRLEAKKNFLLEKLNFLKTTTKK